MAEKQMFTPSGFPCCPNHGEPLEGIERPLPTKGKGKCPVSGVDFAFSAQADETKMVLDIHGNLHKKPRWEVVGEE